MNHDGIVIWWIVHVVHSHIEMESIEAIDTL